jgi:hypothetical protein
MLKAEQLTTTLVISFRDCDVKEDADTWSLTGLHVQILSPEAKWRSESIAQMPEMTLIHQRTVPTQGPRYALNNWAVVTQAQLGLNRRRKKQAITKLTEKHLPGGFNAGSGGQSVSSPGSSVSSDEDNSEDAMDTEEEMEREEEEAAMEKMKEDIRRDCEEKKMVLEEDKKKRLAMVKSKEAQLEDRLAMRTGFGWTSLNGMQRQPKDQSGAFLFPLRSDLGGASGGQENGNKDDSESSDSSDDSESSDDADVDKNDDDDMPPLLTGELSKKRKAPSSDSEASKPVLGEEIFREHQPAGSMTCGMHALNNVFQRNCRNSKACQQ